MRLAAYRAFLDQLHTLLQAGLPIIEALRGLERSPHRSLALAASDMAKRIADGSSLKDAAFGRPDIFPPAHAALIGAGEKAGTVPAILARLRDEVDRKIAARKALAMQAAYPVAILALATILPPVYLLFKGSYGAYFAIQATVFGTAAILISLAWLFRKQLAAFLPAVPFIGRAWRRAALGESLSLLGLLVRAGIGLREGLTIAAEAARLPDLCLELQRAARGLDSGLNLSGALGFVSGIEAPERGAIASGEQAGTMDAALESAGKGIEESASRTIKVFLSALAFGIYIIAAGVVGLLFIQAVLQYYGPIFELSR
jgi:type II secretory pathway component PulF